MIQKFIAILISFGATVLFTMQNVQADPITNTFADGVEDIGGILPYAYYQNSGDFMFLGGDPTSGSFNDSPEFNNGILETKVEDWLGVIDPDTFTLNLGSGLSFTNYNDDGTVSTGASKSGTWATSGSPHLLNFYVVKAGSNYAMYHVDPADSTGSWSTYDLWIAGYGGKGGLEISHFNGYYSNNSEVPEPATMILFGTGLAGLAGLSRRRRK